jgi:hypothetical protein
LSAGGAPGIFDEVYKIAATRGGEKKHFGWMAEGDFEAQDTDVEVFGLFEVARSEGDVA